MFLKPRSLFYAIAGLVFLLAAVIVVGLPLLTSSGFGRAQFVACVAAGFLVWFGFWLSKKTITLAEVKSTIFKLNCSLFLAVGTLAGIEVLAYIVLMVSPGKAALDDRYAVFQRAKEAAYRNCDWSDEHLLNFGGISQKYVYRPYFLWTYQPQETSTLNIDDEWSGVRRTICADANEAGRTINICMFGGSTLFCKRSPDANTIASEVAAELQRRHPDHVFQVVNFGMSGHLSDQEVVRLTQVLTGDGRADLVIFYDGVNDKLNKVARGAPHAQFPRFKSVETDETNYGKAPWGGVFECILHYDYINRATRTFFTSDRIADYNSYCQDENEVQRRAKELARRYRQNLEFVAKLGSACGFEPVHFWQPDILNTAKTLSAEEVGLLHDVRSQRLKDAFRAGDDAINREMHGLNNWYDISNALDDVDESVFFDFCHVSALANRAVAKSMVDKLEDGQHLQRVMSAD